MTSRTTDLVFEAGVAESMLDHARAGASTEPPAEVCGVLAGHRSESGESTSKADGSAHTAASGPETVTAAEPVPNVAADPRTEYDMDPAATVETIDRVESAGLDVVGFYHSHPESDPVPSRTDEERATWTGYVYAICNPDGRVNAYHWTGSAFDPLRVTRRE